MQWAVFGSLPKSSCRIRRRTLREVKVEKKEHNITELVVELPVEAANKAFDKAFQKLAQQVNIPGFRKGKAPRKLIESRVGIDGMRAEAFDFIIPDAYRERLRKTQLTL